MNNYTTSQERIESRIDALKKVWFEFVTTGKMYSNDLVSAEVLSSWIRSRNRKIDYQHVPAISLSEEELKIRMKKNQELLDVAIPFLQAIAEDVEGTGFRVDLFDAECYLLWTQGDANILKDSKQRSSIALGVCRSESVCGTNAINLAALLEKPVQLLGPEHYNVALQHWTCSSVPIKNEKNKVIAVINAAGYYWLIHKHTLGMMAALGKSIEYCLLQKSVQKKLEQTNRFYKNVMDSSADALIVVDSTERVVMMNTAAEKIWGSYGFSIKGKQVNTIWGETNPFTEVLQTKQSILDREIPFRRENKVIRLMGSIRLIDLIESGQGVVGNFKAHQQTRRMIKNFVGWKAHFSFEDLIGESNVFRQVIRLARETAKMGSNVLIQGESGTGKELFAQAIHNGSQQNEGPFVVINCAAIPSGLIESELFGYEGGAFTGAKKEGQPGKFELAEGGSIFLDEINSLPMEVQAKILRTLQNKMIVRLGSRDEIPLNVRVIAASNADLWQMVQKGEFREDLFYRINVITINLPPLRERGEDLALLIEHILHNKKILKEFFPNDVINLLYSYEWPGNVRELENVLERSFVLARSCGRTFVEKEDVCNYPGIERSNKMKENNFQRINKRENVIDLKENEKMMIEEALRETKGNVTAVAILLGIPRNTLYRKMKKFKIR